MPFRLLFALCFGIVLNMSAYAADGKRVALVIGNGDYKNSPLKSPSNDAKDMAATLRRLGFEVIEKTNATQKDMNRAIVQFGEKLRSDTVALFFFSGYGMQVRGKNYIVPVDANITSEAAVRAETVDMDTVLDQLADSPANIVILDAGRSNPFERKYRGSNGGLAQVAAPKGGIVAYATAPGKTAPDGSGRNGLYTQELLKHIQIPGLTLDAIFEKVRNGVMAASGERQTPWESSSFNGDFYFVEPTTVQVGAAAASESQLWSEVKSSGNRDYLNAYLKQYPKGTFLALANIELKKIDEREQADRNRALAQRPQDDQKAIPIACPIQVSPVMPRVASQNAFGGFVRASFAYKGGEISDIRILSGPLVFHEAVRNALIQYKCNKDFNISHQEFNFRMEGFTGQLPRNEKEFAAQLKPEAYANIVVAMPIQNMTPLTQNDIFLACPIKVNPEMPRKAIAEGASGRVVAEATIRNGVVDDVQILSGPRVFHASVRNAMTQYKCLTTINAKLVEEFYF